eukprot:369491-Pleurochrysis_carterae.AAC.1
MVDVRSASAACIKHLTHARKGQALVLVTHEGWLETNSIPPPALAGKKCARQLHDTSVVSLSHSSSPRCARTQARAHSTSSARVAVATRYANACKLLRARCFDFQQHVF